MNAIVRQDCLYKHLQGRSTVAVIKKWWPAKLWRHAVLQRRYVTSTSIRLGYVQ